MFLVPRVYLHSPPQFSEGTLKVFLNRSLRIPVFRCDWVLFIVIAVNSDTEIKKQQ